MAHGTVKFFNAAKNYGFINGEDGTDYFVHGSACDDDLKEGDRVEFEATEGDKGPRAQNVKKTGEAVSEIHDIPDEGLAALD